jgi:signal peptidase I
MWLGDPVQTDPGVWMQTEAKSAPQTRSALREVVETLVFTLLIYLLVRTFLFENYRVVGASMRPTLENGEFLVVNKLGYRLHEPQRGDIVVFQDPNAPDRKLIKRIIGLPGETVEMVEGAVLIDQQVLPEPYLEEPGYYTSEASVLPADQYFVLGDNRNNSSDSRSWGTLPRADIVGKAWLTYWPPRMWGAVPPTSYGAEQ